MKDITISQADHLGGDGLTIAALLQSLQDSERAPDPATRLVVVLPNTESPVLDELGNHLAQVRQAGWRDGVVAVLPASSNDCALSGAQYIEEDARVLLAPLAITPGPFTERVAACAVELGVDNARVSLHAADPLCALICRRVTDARRR